MVSLVKRMSLALVLAAVLSVPAFAQVASIDYIGFGYETGGIFPSDPGDELVIAAIADWVDAEFGVDLGIDELTFHVYGLTSAGQIDAGGTTVVNYVGGYLEIYQDSSKNADWGVNPPNATSPGTFTDGSLFFQGSFNDFTLFFTPDGNGAFEGSLDASGGTMIDGSCADCVYSWGGSFTRDAGAQIPGGYHLQIDGVFQIDSAVSSETSNWGSVKALFNN